MRHLLFLAALALLAPTVLAQSVIVVDDDPGPGVDYTDLQVACNVANPGDRIEVRHGSYGNVNVRKPLTIMGEPFASHHNGPAAEALRLAVFDLTPTDTVVVTDMRVELLRASGSDGILIADRVDADHVFVNDFQDVRLRDVSVDQPQSTQEYSAIRVANDSFVQAVGCTFRGRDLPPGMVGYRSHGLRVNLGATMIVSDCAIEGGAGSSSSNCSLPGDRGGAAIHAQVSSVRVLSSVLTGGPGGVDCSGNSAPDGGSIESWNSDFTTSDTQLIGATWGNTPSLDVPGLATMLLDGGTSPGQVANFRARMLGGSSARLFLGRRPIIEPEPGVDVPQLHSAERPISLGFFPASGEQALPFAIPPLPRGTLVFVQVKSTRASGATNYSNAVTLVVR